MAVKSTEKEGEVAFSLSALSFSKEIAQNEALRFSAGGL